ncbi:ABC transporter ATP-binding protein [Streptomyces erythrochromogenes]|uniref:ABC transporter ATP-binding protein n=1 Tax=Streptomyces erythrochromogenes TaxID=285574 RepID=UPI0022523448|nr:ABC transporter ATP-binding protein [Streptomyces erythrochromogenes]MCX5588924.1 ABC transporter ATP-binding protein/permease [Streptomyces erythrochromogenes]
MADSTPAPRAAFDAPRLRVLWSFARPHRRTLAMGLVLALAGSALGLATPMITKWVLDALNDATSLTGPVTALFVLLVVGAAVSYRQWCMLGTVGERVVLEARESMVRRFLHATVPALTRRPTGELVTRVTSDTVLLREATAQSFVGLVNGSVMLVGSLVLMGVLDLVLLGTTMAAVAVTAALFALLMPGIGQAQQRSQEHIGRLGGLLEGTLRAIRTVKVSRAEERAAERIVADARAAADYGIRAVRQEALAWTVAGSGIQLAIIAILGVGAWRVGEGSLEVSSLIAFLLYAFTLMEPVSTLSQNVTSLQAGMAAAERIRQTADLTAEGDDTVPRQADERTARTAESGAPAEVPVLELRGVSAAYGPEAAHAVTDVRLAVPRRGHTAIVGPSGAGKTTLFSLVLRFLEPVDGELLLNGRPYRDYSHSEVRARLAYVEQDTPVVPGTLRDNLLLARPDATDEELRRVLRDVRLTEKVDALEAGLDSPLSSAHVSGGERQRIALARALLRTPEVLLLDEATAQLDGLTEAAVQDCIRSRAATGAVVTVAHRLSTVVDADLIVVMEAGRIRARGTHEELLETDPLYRELVAALRLATTAGAEMA